MAEQILQTGQYLDYTGLSHFYDKLKSRYDGCTFNSIVKSADGKKITFTPLEGQAVEINTEDFIKDGMLNDVSIWTKTSAEEFVPGYDTTEADGSTKINTKIGDKFIMFKWNVDSKDGEGKVKVDYIKTTDIGMTYVGKADEIVINGGQISISENYTLKDDKLVLGTNIVIAGGPLAEDFKKVYENGIIPQNTSLFDILSKLACVESWPETESISWTYGTLKSSHQTIKKDASTAFAISDITTVKNYKGTAKDSATRIATSIETETVSGTNGFYKDTVTIPSAYVTKPQYTVPSITSSGFATSPYKGHFKSDGSKVEDEVTISANSSDIVTTPGNHKLELLINDASIASATGTDNWESLSLDGRSYSLIKGNNKIQYKSTGTVFSGAKIASAKNNNAYNYKPASNLGNIGNDTFTPFKAALNASTEGSYNGNDFVFIKNASATSTTAKTFVGYYPIFSNILPVTIGSKYSIKGADFAVTAKLGLELTDVQKTITSNSGNTWLKPLPIGCLRTNGSKHEITLGWTNVSNTAARQEASASAIPQGLFSPTSNTGCAIIVYPATLTLTLTVNVPASAGAWEVAPMTPTVKKFGTINGVEYKYASIFGDSPNAASAYNIEFSGKLS